MNKNKTIINDLDILKVCEITKYQIQDLSRIPLSESIEMTEIFTGFAFAGNTFNAILTLQERLPILNLSFEVESSFNCKVKPIDYVIFPEENMLCADIISDKSISNVNANSTTSFLIECKIEENCLEGIYPIKLILNSSTHNVCEIEFNLVVIKIKDEKINNDFTTIFWTHWETFCNYLNIELWSEKFWIEAEKYLKEMANGGMNSIMVSICHDPFRYPFPKEYYCYNYYPTMIKWYKKNNKWSFDYSIYDRYVELNLKLGIDKEIECHSMLPCKNQNPYISYWDENDDFISFETQYNSPEYIEAWSAFLNDFSKHNREKKWINLLTICPYDEPVNADSFRFVANLAKSIIPEIKITAAITSTIATKLSDCIDIATLHLAANYDENLKRELEENNIELGWYNCCSPNWGNSLFCCRLEDAYRQSWIGYANNFKRFLRWSIVNWPMNVLSNSSFNWPSGDTYLLYPNINNPLESLRWRAYKYGKDDLKKILFLRNNANEETEKKIDNFVNRVGKLGKIDDNETINSWRNELKSFCK